MPIRPERWYPVTCDTKYSKEHKILYNDKTQGNNLFSKQVISFEDAKNPMTSEIEKEIKKNYESFL